MTPEETMEKVIKRVDGAFIESTTRSTTQKFASMGATQIKARTRAGFGVRNGRKIRLKPLAKSTIEQRKRTRLSPLTSPRRSNLTRTGEMLRNIVGRGLRQRIVIRFSRETRRDGKRNSDIAGFVEKDRPFFSLTNREVNSILRSVGRKIRDVILT